MNLKKWSSLMNLLLGVFMTLIVCSLFKISLSYCWIIFLACYPWRLGKNLYSAFGGFNPDGGIYSLLAVIQHAKTNAKSILGLAFLQEGEKGDVACLLGWVLFQKAGGNANLYIGLTLQQTAEHDAFCMIGIILLNQKAKTDALIILGFVRKQDANHDAFVVVGLCPSQQAWFGQAEIGCGLCFWQKGYTTRLTIGAVIVQTAKDWAYCSIGLALIQKAQNNSYIGCGIPLWQSGEDFGYGFNADIFPSKIMSMS
jgi:hypothetical protein